MGLAGGTGQGLDGFLGLLRWQHSHDLEGLGRANARKAGVAALTPVEQTYCGVSIWIAAALAK